MTNSAQEKNRRVLVIDDNPAIHEDFRKILSGALDAAFAEAEARVFRETQAPLASSGFQIDTASQGREGWERMQQAVEAGRPYAMAFVDVRMPPGWDGIETTAKLWKLDPDLQVVICTAYSDYSVEEMIEKLGRSDRLLILKKPFENVEVLQLANALTEKWQLLQQARTKLADLERIVTQRTQELKLSNEQLRAEIAERTQAAEALRSTQERLNHLLGKSPVVLYSLKVEGRTLLPTWASANLEAMLGCPVSEWCQPQWRQEHLCPDDQALLLAAQPALLEQKSSNLEYRLRHANGTYRWIRDESKVLCDAQGTPVEVVGAYTDITERRHLEEQLRQSQKMEALGQLAGGVAHDFNNLLTVISSYGTLMIEDKDLPTERIDQLKQILNAADRAADLTRQLLAYGRRQVMRPQELDLGELVGELAKMLGRILGEDIALQVECAQPGLTVRADRTMLEQVVLNLATNARDAMPRGGHLTLRTTSVQVNPNDLQSRPDTRPGRFVCLTAQDTGRGIAPEILPHVFEPFFTTKEVGKGTGLGLTTVYGIVRLHQGWIQVESEPGQGATFKILLPATECSATKTLPPVAGQRQAGGTETILFVEDEPALRKLGRIVLQRRGYQVLVASSGVEALDVWKEQGSKIDLLVTDLVMPDGLTGCELATTLTAEKANLKVLFMSGYSAELLKDNCLAESGIHFLPKPFSSQALADAVRGRLDATDPLAQSFSPDASSYVRCH